LYFESAPNKDASSVYEFKIPSLKIYIHAQLSLSFSFANLQSLYIENLLT